MQHIRRLTMASLALAAMSTSAFATGVPVNCLNGEKVTPQDPIIIPAWIEDVPDIQHDGWIEVTPDIYHPAEYADKWFSGGPVGSLKGKTSTDPLCGPDHAGSGYQRPGGYCDQAKSLSSLVPANHGKWKSVLVKDEYVEDVPDIEHEPYVEVTEDIYHPEQVIPQPDLVEPEKTIVWLVGLDKHFKPIYEYTKHPGTCQVL